MFLYLLYGFIMNTQAICFCIIEQSVVLCWKKKTNIHGKKLYTKINKKSYFLCFYSSLLETIMFISFKKCANLTLNFYAHKMALFVYTWATFT